MEENQEKMQADLSTLNAKVDQNHKQAMSKLRTFEKNQGAIMRYFENADITFKKTGIHLNEVK